MENQEQISLGKYHLNNFANGIKKFTNSTPMVSIVNAFIAMMPIIIAASIFTLLAALPEMFIKVFDQSLSTETSWQAWLKSHPAFSQYQTWANTISNWSMGLLGMLVTAMIARNMGEQLNNKLPMARKMNLNTIFIAGISCYIMLSVIEFTVGDDYKEIWGHTGRAIFVDGLAAQGILPGIIIGLTLPYVFYFTYKHNWTIRLPKQVPQTISQAFLGVIPLFLALAIFGSIAFGLNKACGMPVLFWLFTKIQEGFTSNPNINDSYGLIAAYSLMESGFWFLGVHPEPVHAVMRATFWFQNSAQGGHIFTEPLMYGFGAMGGSGTTLMVPMLCLLMCHSTKMRVTGKTAVVPIVFQVNEPALFGVPLILNPIFAFPFVFTGLINNELFAVLAKNTGFVGGTLYLPWSTPYFLQTTLGTPTQWQPWLWCIVSLAICTATYAPFVKMQDKIYLKEEMRQLGLESVNFHPVSWNDIIIREVFKTDPVANKEYRTWKKSFKIELKEYKEDLDNKLFEYKDSQLHITERKNIKKLYKNKLKKAKRQERVELRHSKDKESVIKAYIATRDKIKQTKNYILIRFDLRYTMNDTIRNEISRIKAENANLLATKKQELKAKYYEQLPQHQYEHKINTFLNIVRFYMNRSESKSIQLNNKKRNMINKYEKQISDKKKSVVRPVEKLEEKIQIWKEKKETLQAINNAAELDSFTKESSQKSIDKLLDKIEKALKKIEVYKNKKISVSLVKSIDVVGVKIQNELAKQVKHINIKVEKLGVQIEQLNAQLRDLQAQPADDNIQAQIEKLQAKINKVQAKIDHTKGQLKLDVKFLEKSPEVRRDKYLMEYKHKMDIKIFKTLESYKRKNERALKKNPDDEYIKKALALPEYVEYKTKFTSLDDINKKYWEVVNEKTQTTWKEIFTKEAQALLDGYSPWTAQEVSPKADLAKVLPKEDPEALDKNKKYNVLVLCLGAGSSAVAANKISEGLKPAGYPNIDVNALAWGTHESALNNVDLVILSPQLGIHLKALSTIAKEKGFKLHACRGMEYIELSKDADKAASFVLGKLKGK